MNTEAKDIKEGNTYLVRNLSHQTEAKARITKETKNYYWIQWDNEFTWFMSKYEFSQRYEIIEDYGPSISTPD